MIRRFSFLQSALNVARLPSIMFGATVKNRGAARGERGGGAKGEIIIFCSREVDVRNEALAK